MSVQRVAYRYAKSLLDISIEQQNIEVIKKDMELFYKALTNNLSLRTLFKNPIVKSDKKIAVIQQIFGKHFQPITLSFFGIVLRKGRGPYVKDIAQSYIDQYNELHAIQKATVKSAVTLNAETLREIEQFMSGALNKNIIIEQIVDPKLIGGISLQIGDRLFDGSISGKLQKAKKELLNSYISK